MHCPTSGHWVVIKRLLRYLCDTIHHALFLRHDSLLSLHAYSDVDWTGNHDDHTSSIGQMLTNNLS